MNRNDPLISFTPLFETLKEQGLVISFLREKNIHPATIAKINKNQSITLGTVALICDILQVPIEKVVRIKINN